MQPIDGDTLAVWIADAGTDRAHDAELLLYAPPDPVTGDVSAVWISADGYRWAYADRLEELTGGLVLLVPALAIPLALPLPSLVAGALLAAPALALVLHAPVPAFSDDLILRAPALALGPSVLPLPSLVAGALLAAPALALTLGLPVPAVAIELVLAVPALALRPALPLPNVAAGATLAAPRLALALGRLLAPHLLVIPSADIPGQTVYDLTLTGAADGQPDVVLPISTFQGRLRDGSPSYLQVTVPNAGAWAEAVTLRPNGQLVLRKGKKFADGSRQMEEIARVDLESIADDRGARSQTITLSGHRTTSATAPKERTLAGLNYRHAGTGKRRHRGLPDMFLRPGDTAIIPGYGEQVVVGLITYVVGGDPVREMMEITEA